MIKKEYKTRQQYQRGTLQTSKVMSTFFLYKEEGNNISACQFLYWTCWTINLLPFHWKLRIKIRILLNDVQLSKNAGQYNKYTHPHPTPSLPFSYLYSSSFCLISLALKLSFESFNSRRTNSYSRQIVNYILRT